MASAALPLTAKDFTSDQEVRWCPGCGDFSVLAALKQVLASLGLPREQIAFVSGVGCSSRIPYYLNTYGFQTLHGRAPTVATGLKLARPELSVWVITGDGDGLSIGGNHLIHALRRNVDLKILLFNNEVMGLTRGQYSPTSRVGTRSRANPQGSIDEPLRAMTMAAAAGATFIARTIDVDVTHLTETLQRAAAHKGSAFVEIYQNCKVFNDGVFEYATEKGVKADNLVYLEDGKPLVFGQDHNRGIRLRGLRAEAVTLTNGTTPADLLVHDERDPDTTRAHLLSRMVYPQLPECVGVLRCVERPTYGDLLDGQIEEAIRAEGPGRLEDLFGGGDAWTVAG
jgi:2-oxoglutarate ferredoxin oxidoreductase subunit beta